jgi:NAD(P)-dependent dehydrogenase (short-subunit alcohol dehydrogenase family)
MMLEPGVIAVTGASRGIGSAIALELARRGFTVGCLSRQGRGPEDAAPEEAIAKRLIPLVCDVTEESQVVASLHALAGRPEGLGGIVNNAGIYQKGPSERLTLAEFEKVLRTDVLGLFAVCRAAYPHLVRRSGGLIVNLGSFFDKMGVPQHLAYSAAKAAVGAMTRCLAVEWAAKGIAVINVAPGYVETDFNREFLARPEVKAFMAKRIPVGRTGAAAEVARLVAALFTERIGYLTGETIYIDGGHGMAH